MPLIKDNTRRVQSILRGRIAAGLSEAAKEGSAIYKAELKKNTHEEYPDGPFPGPFSVPGEYPYRQTGQGFESVDYARAKRRDRRAAFGVLGDAGAGPKTPYHKKPGGMHLIWLTARGRLGPIDVMMDNVSALVRKFMFAARKVNR